MHNELKKKNSRYSRIRRRQKLLNDHPTTLLRHLKKKIQILTILINICYLIIILKNNLPKSKPQSKAIQLKYQSLKHILSANCKFRIKNFTGNV